MSTVPAFQSQPNLKPLSFNPAKLAGLAERLIRSHWENNYGGSAKALGVVKQHLSEALTNKDTPPYIYNALKREQLLRTGSVVLHEYYFDNLDGDGQAGAATAKYIDAFFKHIQWDAVASRLESAQRAGL
jgi:Fe-Mn family superoxide dismutase